MGIESFDPVEHVSKEKADTVSMWLVITFAATMALVMRYVQLTDKNRISEQQLNELASTLAELAPEAF